MLKIIIQQVTKKLTRAESTVEIADEHAPAFRSAIEEQRNEVGGRLEGAHAFAKEDALTRASVALNTFAAGLNNIVPEGDSDYE